MGHGPEENYTDLDFEAFKIYLVHIKERGADEYFSMWYFVDTKDKFKSFYDDAKIKFRKDKIKKIINGR